MPFRYSHPTDAQRGTMNTRFTLVHKHPFGEQEHKFFTLGGLEQWLDNARAEGKVKELDKIAIYDDSGVKL